MAFLASERTSGRWCPTTAGLLASLLFLAASCGAGLVGGLASSNDGGGGGGAPAPGLSVPAALVLPLRPDPGTTHTLVVTNARLETNAGLRVLLSAAGRTVEQRSPSAAVQGAGSVITYTLDTAAIVAAVGDPTAADVPAELAIWIGDRPLAPPAPLVLVRQPSATLQLPPGEDELFVSPLGQRVELRVEGLRSADPSLVTVLVVTPDPASGGGAVLQRVASQVTITALPDGAQLVGAVLPGNSIPCPVQLLVRDAIAGTSPPVLDAYYRPEITLALPGQGPTTGGSLLTLIGTALVPRDLGGGSGPAPFDFGAVTLSFQKGGRVVELPDADFRTEQSGGDRLVFTMPPSPDGRPGQVDIVLTVDLGVAQAQVTASQVFLFANPDPFFGPRGAVLDRLPIAVAPILLDGAIAGGGSEVGMAPDMAVLTEQGGVAFLQLLLAQRNGMFQRFAAPRAIGDLEVAAERDPRDLVVGDFDGDLVPDLLVGNAGAATAVHHVVQGQGRPLPPLGAVHRIPAPGGSWQARAARFDGDAIPDVLLVPGPLAPPGALPHVLLARPTGFGQPAFLGPFDLPLRSIRFEAVEVADLDDDGHLDVAAVSGVAGSLDIAFGRGDGSFDPAVSIDFQVPGYTLAPGSTAVGLHAVQVGSQRALALVLSGLDVGAGSAATPPTIALLRATGPRTFAAPDHADSFSPPIEPIGRSLAADLDGVPPFELVVAVRGEPQFVSLGLLQLRSDGIVPIAEAIEGGAESPKQIRTILFDTAFPATPDSLEAKAVFLVHETDVDGVREKRLSTRLVVQPGDPVVLLLPPDAGDRVGFPITGLVAGDFHDGGAAVLDLALVSSGQAPESIVLVANDGFGGIARLGNRMEHAGLLPSSLCLLPSGPVIDGLVFVDAESRVGFWRNRPDGAALQQPDALSTPLRDLSPDLAGATLLPTSRLRCADVDGDSVPDLVALLHFQPLVGDERAALVLLRGDAAATADDLPFVQPTGLCEVPRTSTGFELGDFAAAGPGQPLRLELALAVPQPTEPGGLDGNHVRFYRHLPGATAAADRFVASAAPSGPQVLLAGSNPTELTSDDFDGDGLTDLLVACGGDATLRLHRNTSMVDPGQPDVAVGAFLEALGSPLPLAVGTPTRLQLSDVNGDGNRDAVVTVEFTSATTQLRSTSVGIYLSSGSGELLGPRFASPKRLGDRDGRLFGDVGDWNRDGVPDLLVGWDTNGVNDINLRVLFGGTR